MVVVWKGYINYNYIWGEAKCYNCEMNVVFVVVDILLTRIRNTHLNDQFLEAQKMMLSINLIWSFFRGEVWLNWLRLVFQNTLPETNIFAPENGWLENSFPFGARPIFRGKLLVLGSVALESERMSTLKKEHWTKGNPTSSNDQFSREKC